MTEAIMDAVKHIDYNPDTGEIRRIDRKGGGGSIDAYGYLIIKIKGRQWKAHRLAWAKYYGVPPAKIIDHIDGNKTNNRIANLRDVEQGVNVRNTKRDPNPITGVVGVYLDRSTNGLLAKYTTRFNGKTYRFRELGDAIAFREKEGMPV